MFTMRPAAAADQAEIAGMIGRRAAWMRARGLEGADGWGSKAEMLASGAADPDVPVWACAGPDGRIAGVTTLGEEMPSWGWTEAEQAQPSIFLSTTVTDPAWAGQRVGCLMAWWTLDHAARHGFAYVRRGCGFEGLVRYYRDVQGWELVRTVDRKGWPAYLLSRRAKPQPGLADITC